MTLTWQQIRERRTAKPLEHVEWMVLDPDLRREWQEASAAYLLAQMRLAQLRDGSTPDDTLDAAEAREQQAQARLDEVQRRCDEAGVMVPWRFRPVAPAAYEELKRAHPPVKKGESWGPDFGPELISACLVEPQMTVDDVNEMRKSSDWSPAEYDQLLGAALTICQASTSVRVPGKG